MNPLEALRLADPARRLGHPELDARDEQLLREILAAAPATGASTPARVGRGSPARDRRPLLATAIVAIVVVVAAVVAIRSARESSEPVAAAPTSTTRALEDAVFARLGEVATGDVPVRDKSALTWTQASRSADGDGIDTTGKTLYIAAACEGGGSIAIEETGRPDVTLACDRFSTVGPIDLTPSDTTDGGASLSIVTTSGHPRYVAKAMAFPTPRRSK